MKLKLNKTIKNHICQMAIRNKFEAEFKVVFNNICSDAGELFYKESNGELFESADPIILEAVKKCKSFEIDQTIYLSENTGVAIGFKFGYIKHFTATKFYYGKDCRTVLQKDNEVFKDLILLIKEIQSFEETIMQAMNGFKSASKMFAELPWTEDLYPQSEKKPTCNIVPVSTIAKANDLMGVKVQKP